MENNYPFGTPLASTDAVSVGFPLKNGKYLYVDAATGSNGLSGTTADNALKTIAQALVLAQSGDVIFIAPGTYAENLVVTKDYITMIGYSQSGYARPDIVPVAGPALIVSTGQGFVAKHIRFSSADSDVVVQNANGFKYEDCVFDGSAGMSATELLLRLVPSATNDAYSASEGKILNNLFRGSNGSGIGIQHALAAGGGEGTTDNEIVGNRFYGNVVSDIKSFVNTNGGGAGIYINYSIHNNQFLTTGASYVYINFAAGAAGDLTANACLISDNYFADEAIIAAQILLTGQAKAHFAGNFDDVGIINGSSFNN